jgi:membrane protein YdbS with pleckstrin-like domain
MEPPSFYEPPEGMSEANNVLRLVLSAVLILAFLGLVVSWYAFPHLWFVAVAAVLVLVMTVCVKVINRINAGVSKAAIAKTLADQNAAMARGLRRLRLRR